jgi:site-specific DNA recombinase
MRVAIYARFSSDQQRQTSIEDQQRAARARAAAEGWQVVIERSDAAISGATPFTLRPGSKALLADALAGRFDVLIVESLDRTFRNLADQEMTVKRLEHRGVRIIGLLDHYDSTNGKQGKVARVVRGLFAETYLDDLADKTHRGMAGSFARGEHSGGRTYGYTSEPLPGSEARRMVIDEKEATTVRWIFEQYAAGLSVRAIVHDLNRRGVPSARDGTWAVSAVQGSFRRGLGLLNNELYIGRVIWNRRQWLKDPETGVRRYVERPREEWQVREAPELRIISPQLWQAVQSEARHNRSRGKHFNAGAPARMLFTGMLRCKACGGPFVAVNGERYGCGVHKDRGPSVCPSSVTVLREVVDKRLLAEVRSIVLAPDAQAEMQRILEQVLAEQVRNTDAPEIERQMKALDEEIANLVDAVASMRMSVALRQRLEAAELARARLLEQLELSKPVAEGFVHELMARHKRQVLELRKALEDMADRDHVRRLLADLVGEVTIERDADGQIWAEVPERVEHLLEQASNASGRRVAGAGFVASRRILLA